MASWPTSFPRPLVDGYKVTAYDAVTRTDMEGGNTRARRNSFSRNDKVACTISLTDALMEIFRNWFDSPLEANAGASWFSTNLLMGTGGEVAVEARFSSMWQADYLGNGHWKVNMNLDVRYA